MTNNREKILIKKCISGNEESLEILIRSYLKPIYNFIYRYVGNAGDAEDMTQEVFVKVWRHLKKFNRSKSFKTWIFSIAKNTAIDFLKKKKTIPFSEFSARGETSPLWGGENEKEENAFIETLVDPSPLPQEIFEKQSVSQILAHAMDKLSPKYRMVLFLRYNDHFTFREIAESLGEPLHTVKSRYRRAIIILRKEILNASICV